MNVRIHSLFLLVGLLLAVAVYGQQTGGISGTVRDRAGLISDATVYLGSDLSLRTDRSGQFRFSDIPAGTYVIRVSALGYEAFRDTIIKAIGQDLTLDITLQQETRSVSEVTVVGKTETQQAREQAVRATVVDTRSVSTQASSLTELMNSNTGIRVRQNGGLGSRPDILINGFQGRSIKYFKDGIPLDFLGEGYNIASLPFEVLERVEVYKGVLPISLGADALGGAVNLISRRNVGRSAIASYEVGSFNTHRAAFSWTYMPDHQRWATGADVFYTYSDNDYDALVSVPDPVTRNPEMRRLPLFHNAFRNVYVDWYASVINRSWADELKIGLSAFNLNREQQHPALMTDAYGAVEAKQHTIAPTVRYKNTLFDDRLTIDQFASYNILNTQRIDTLQGSYDWFGNFTPRTSLGESRLPSQSDVDEKQVTARTHIQYRLSEQTRLNFNYVFTQADRTGEDPLGPRLAGTDIDVLSLLSKYQKNVFGLSLTHFLWGNTLQNELMGKYYLYRAQGIQNVWYAVDITDADRRDQKGSYWGIADAIKWQINTESLARASVEWTYRLPERDELFGNNVFIVPNFDLTPERSLNINLGYRWQKSGTYTAEINGFFRNTEGMILLVPIQPPNAQYQNQEHVRGFGVDIDMAYHILPNLVANANATWQDMRLYGIQLSQDQWKNDARLRNTPYFFANAGLNWSKGDVFGIRDKISTYLNYNFMREFYLETIPRELEAGGFLGLSGSASVNSNLIIPNQHLMTVGATYEFADNRIIAGLEARNLFNTDLYDYYRVQKAGRSFHLKLSYKLF